MLEVSPKSYFDVLLNTDSKKHISKIGSPSALRVTHHSMLLSYIIDPLLFPFMTGEFSD